MADVRAFRGTFYNPRAVEDISRTVAPPYDVIDDNRRESLLSRSPYNIVRVILPQSAEEREFWNNSATLYRAWKRGEVLAADAGRSLYVYRQSFELPGEGTSTRTGIIALLRCKEFSSGEILPHEKTFPRTREERLRLLRACRANFSQVFTIFRDERGEALPFLEEAMSSPPFMDIRDDEGIGHRLWRVGEGEITEGITALLEGKRLIIADGHHRYETALSYSREARAGANAPHPSSYVSVALFRSEDPGLAILPVHRLLRHLPVEVDEIESRLSRFFHLETIQAGISERRGMFRERLEAFRKPAFVMITRERTLLLVLREGVRPEVALRGSESSGWKRLDVPILHAMVIGEGLGMDADALAASGDLAFTPWESKALDAVAGGEADAAFLVRPTRMGEIWEIAEGGERMPHKSSYFYPKLPSGLVIYDHENGLAR